MRSILILIVSILITFNTAEGDTSNKKSLVELKGATLHLQFDLARGSVEHWVLPDINTTSGEDRDLVTPSGLMFLLCGTLAEKDIQLWEKELGGWVIQNSSPNSLTLRIEHPKKYFTIDKTWSLKDSPWRATFQISLNLKKVSENDSLWLQFGPGIGEVPSHGLGFAQSIYSFTEVVYKDNESVQTVRLNDERNHVGFEQDNLLIKWVGMQSRYFALMLSPTHRQYLDLKWSAKIPTYSNDSDKNRNFETSLFLNLPLISNPSEPLVYEWNVYGGGKAYDVLNSGDPKLGSILFSNLWNWLRILTLGTMHVLNAIYTIVGNWGISIILLAVLVRLIMHPLAKKAMAAQKQFAELQEKIQPELDHIKKNYRGGEQSERILQLYEKHNTSPFAGIRPLFVVMLQIPIFVALYHLLGQDFELRNEPFLWMETLSDPDRLFGFGMNLPFFGAYFNLLPAIMALTNIVSIKLSPLPKANHQTHFRQNIMLSAMALVFFLLFYSFPSGMVLYWTTANILQIIHQKLIVARRQP